MNVLTWLLDSDPAIRWQVLRDLTTEAESEAAAARARITHEGLGAQILRCQGADGAWHRSDAPDWLPTLFTAQFLRRTGVNRDEPAVVAAMERLARGFRWHEQLGHGHFFEGETEPCINGGALAIGAYFGRPSAPLLARLLAEQLGDGGWNCEAPASSRSSFHTTICVLEGLLEYERSVEPSSAITAARQRGEAYLLERALFRRRSTGAVASEDFLRIGFPPRYEYDVLRALDYLRAAGVTPEARMTEAIDVVQSLQQPDGRWLLDRSRTEALGFTFDEQVGEPSRWNTLRALRVLRWYHGQPPQAAPERAMRA